MTADCHICQMHCCRHSTQIQAPICVLPTFFDECLHVINMTSDAQPQQAESYWLPKAPNYELKTVQALLNARLSAEMLSKESWAVCTAEKGSLCRAYMVWFCYILLDKQTDTTALALQSTQAGPVTHGSQILAPVCLDA